MKRKKDEMDFKNLVRDCFLNCYGISENNLNSVSGKLKYLAYYSLFDLKFTKDLYKKESFYDLQIDLQAFLSSPKLDGENEDLRLFRRVLQDWISTISLGDTFLHYCLLFILLQWDKIKDDENTYRLLGHIIDTSDGFEFEISVFQPEDLEALIDETDKLRLAYS